MKKVLSFVLNVALCLSLSVSAFAANQPGDTTVTDSKGNVYTLSNPILYTISKEQLAQLSFTEDYVRYSVDGESHDPKESALQSVTVAYAVPSGTTITPPADKVTTMSDGSTKTDKFNLEPTVLEVCESGDGYAIAYEEYSPMYPYTLESAANAFWVIECYESHSVYGNGGGGSGLDYMGSIAFFTPASDELQSSLQGGSSSESRTDAATFSDVAANAYYYDAVQWAVENNITGGTSSTTFTPDRNCTRAEILTFLWRAAGSPEPTAKSNPFTDVKEGDYYYKAALWAKENHVLSENGATFNGDVLCTRATSVLYIWRAAGFLGAEKHSNFADVADTAVYAPAVDWAVERNITKGTSATTFSPDVTCTRAQIVTLLQRAFADQ